MFLGGLAIIGVLVFALWFLTLFYGPIHFARQIKEWKGTKKPIIWTLGWGLWFLLMFCMYITSALILRDIVLFDYYSAIMTAFIITAILWAFVLSLPYFIVKVRLKKNTRYMNNTI